MSESWEGWAVILGKRLRCVFPKDERVFAENEASRYDDADVVRVEVRRKVAKPRKTTKKR